MPTLEEIERPKFEAWREQHGYPAPMLCNVDLMWDAWLARARLEPKWEPIIPQKFRGSNYHDFCPGDEICIYDANKHYYKFKLPELPK